MRTVGSKKIYSILPYKISKLNPFKKKSVKQTPSGGAGSPHPAP